MRKIPNTYLDDAYEYYKHKISITKTAKEDPLSSEVFNRINKMFSSKLVDYVLLGREVLLPAAMGTIIGTRYDRKNKYQYVGSYSNGNIDYDNTVMLDKVGYKIRFRRNGCMKDSVTGFLFMPAWTFRKKLNKLIKEGYGGRFSYLTSKTLHKDEI